MLSYRKILGPTDPTLDRLASDLQNIDAVLSALEWAEQSGITPTELLKAYDRHFESSYGPIFVENPFEIPQRPLGFTLAERLTLQAICLLCVTLLLLSVFLR